MSQFQYPGLARPLALYCADGLVFCARAISTRPAVDPPNPLRPKSPTQLAPDIKAPVLRLYGGADTGIPVAQVEALKAALAAAHKTAAFKIYPGAPHGFHADYRASYREEPPKTSGTRCRRGLRKYEVLS